MSLSLLTVNGRNAFAAVIVMRRRFVVAVKTVVTVVTSIGVLVSNASAASLPVFPGAKGYGTSSVGGSGRNLSIPRTTVYRVSNLSASGSGSLYQCVSATGPRTCIFETSGTIKLTSILKIANPFITIAGQTAPAPGIMIRGAGIEIATNDVLIQHIEVRPGDDKTGPKPTDRDGITVSGKKDTYNVVVDHVSVSWAVDENVNSWYDHVHGVTFSNSIISEALYKSIHPEGPHGMGILIGDNSQEVTITGSLFAHNQDRNPRMKTGSSVEFINNVVYDWGGSSGWNGANLSDTENVGLPVLLNFMGNYYKPGLKSPKYAPIYGKPPSANSRVYVSGNIGPTRPDGTGNEWLISGLPDSYRSLTPALPLSGVSVKSPSDTYAYVLKHAGSRPAERNAIDARVVNDVRDTKGDLKDCISGCSRSVGGWPERKAVTRKLVLPSDINGDKNKNRYTTLEEWLQSYANDVEVP